MLPCSVRHKVLCAALILGRLEGLERPTVSTLPHSAPTDMVPQPHTPSYNSEQAQVLLTPEQWLPMPSWLVELLKQGHCILPREWGAPPHLGTTKLASMVLRAAPCGPAWHEVSPPFGPITATDVSCPNGVCSPSPQPWGRNPSRTRRREAGD